MLTITRHDSLNVLRGDLIKGGAKTPALLRYLPTLGAQHVAYVGTVYGSGAWAVAEASAKLGLRCTLFLAKSTHRPDWLDALPATGATVHWCDPCPVEMIRERVLNEYPDLFHLPLGFDCPDFIQDMAVVLRESLSHSAAPPPPEIWVPCLSGVLARAVCLAFPDIPVHAVSVVKYAGNTGRAILHQASGKFHRPAVIPPPYPACPFSDAKTWEIVEKQGVSGAYLINVGYGINRH